MGQKAPSAKRCIETSVLLISSIVVFSDKKRRAPKGALRREERHHGCHVAALVRKHRAAKGALRRVVARIGLRHDRQESESTERHKAD